MKKEKGKQEKEKLLGLAKQLIAHSEKVRSVVTGFEANQIHKKDFSLGQAFYTTTSPALTKALNDFLKTYGTLRIEMREIAQMSYAGFENLFPALNINYETYYSVAVSLLNLTYQMQLMRLHCYHLLKS